MDLFHAVTQGIDKVLTCQWYEDLKKFDMTGDKRMDTEPGGESTQYVLLAFAACSRIKLMLLVLDMNQSRLRQSTPRSRVANLAVGGIPPLLQPRIDILQMDLIQPREGTMALVKNVLTRPLKTSAMAKTSRSQEWAV